MPQLPLSQRDAPRTETDPLRVLRTWWGGLVRLLELPERSDARGTLVEFDHGVLPFIPRRSFVVRAVPERTTRGGHAHARGEQLLVCLAGAVRVEMRRGEHAHTVALSAGNEALLIGAGVWAQQHYSGPDAVLLVLASEPYDPASYLPRIP